MGATPRPAHTAGEDDEGQESHGLLPFVYSARAEARSTTVGRCGGRGSQKPIGLIENLESDIGQGGCHGAAVVSAEVELPGLESDTDVSLRATPVAPVGGCQLDFSSGGHVSMEPPRRQKAVQGSLSA